MRAALEAVVGNHGIYKARRTEFNTGQKIPFRVSPVPLQLSSEQKHELQIIGYDVTSYFKAVDELYQENVGGIRAILDTGKPQIFLTNQPSHYLFIRPDLIITPQGFSICEIETSPFGLALAEILNRAYQNEGYETIVANGTLPEEIRKNTPIEGNIIFSNKTEAYTGQMTFLADQVFSGNGRNWQAETIRQYVRNEEQSNIYRGFYLEEYFSDPFVRFLLDNPTGNNHQLIPSPTPYLEEKAILSFIYDIRFEKCLRHVLGDASFKHLREIIPPTWIVGQEQYFAPGLPDNVSTSVDLAGLSKSKRTLVLKSSGFSDNSSWKEGVHFLHKESSQQALKELHSAEEDKSHLYVIQQFKKGVNILMKYESQDNESTYLPMSVRVRLTPYFSVINDGQEGKLIAIKATGCENTDFIHATSTSINTAVN